MAVVRNSRVLFHSVPTGYPEPGKTTIYDESQTIDLDNVPLNGGFLIKILVLSIDPYMRGKMRQPGQKSYSAAYEIGQPPKDFGNISISGYAVGVVLRSERIDVKSGDHVYGELSHEEYSIVQNLDRLRIIQKQPSLPWSVYVGAAGMPGKTAWIGWNEFSKAKKGEIAFITAGGGPVGSFVIQLAKRAGLKVIASAGSEDKVAFMKRLGADVAFNYKTTDTQEVLAKEGPIDIYWDNVGGRSLEAALEHSNTYGRFIECGMISEYNSDPYPVKNLTKIVRNSLSVNGFIVTRFEATHGDQFYKDVLPLLESGEIKYTEQLWRGLDTVGDALLAVQRGDNTAKAVIIVADE